MESVSVQDQTSLDFVRKEWPGAKYACQTQLQAVSNLYLINKESLFR